MGIFDSIKKAIFGEAKADTVATKSVPASGGPAAIMAAPASSSTPATIGVPQAAIPAQPIDVSHILDEAVTATGQQLNWKTSIVDLLKALKIDSSLTARKELAHELGFTKSTDDSATMNIWLHKAVLKKLSENGGNVPADLLD